jgi:hypothetical protein
LAFPSNGVPRDDPHVTRCNGRVPQFAGLGEDRPVIHSAEGTGGPARHMAAIALDLPQLALG